MKSQVMYEFKETLKKWAVEIRELKSHRPKEFRNRWHIDELDSEIRKLSRNFRHNHIAYCELRGRTRDEIETPRDDNRPDEYTIDRIKNEWRCRLDEESSICAVA